MIELIAVGITGYLLAKSGKSLWLLMPAAFVFGLAVSLLCSSLVATTGGFDGAAAADLAMRNGMFCMLIVWLARGLGHTNKVELSLAPLAHEILAEEHKTSKRNSTRNFLAAFFLIGWVWFLLENV